MSTAGKVEADGSKRPRCCSVVVVSLGLALLFASGAPRVASAQSPQTPQSPAVVAPAVAVLPFQVNSANALDYLGDSIANLLRSRLEAAGSVRVTDAAEAASVATPQAAAGASEEQLREYARQLGAGFVVTGSITELAGSFSLDVRISSAELVPGKTLVVTAAGEDELLARVNDVADQILAQVAGATPSRVAAILITGADQIEGELRQRLGTRIGELYDPAKVRDDLAALRADPEVSNASVETERTSEGVVVRFAVITSDRIRAPTPAGATAKRVDDVVIRGNQRIESDAIRARIGTTPGGPYRASQVAKDVSAIYTLGFFRDVKVLQAPSPRGGVVVIFEVEENPVVREISISGNDNVDGEKIRDILTLTIGSALDYPLLFENRARIQALYKAEGYYLAQVSHEIETLAPAAVGINFVVEEGDKLKLRDIQFVGNEAFSDRELREGFKTKKWRFWSYATSWFDNSGTYSEPLFLQDLSNVGRLYADDGYIQVQVSEPNVIASPDGLVVSVTIDEGLQFKVGALDVIGDDSVDIDGLRELLRLREGDIFNRTFLTEDVAALTQHYTDRGFYFANVAPLSNPDDTALTVDVVFQVRKGPLYFIRNVNIAGNTITVDPVIRREIPIVEGELYSQREVLIAKQRVQSLGFFEEVDFQVQPTDEPDQIDLDANVVERPTGTFSFGAGFSSQESFVLNGSLSQDNLFGRGYAVQASADLGFETQRFFLSATDPYFLGSNFSLGLTAYMTSVNFEDFRQNQTGVDFMVGHTLSEDNSTRGFARYSWSTRSIDQDDNVDAAAIILRDLIQDDITSSMVGLNVVSDTRNDRVAPTAGYVFGAGVDFAGLGFFSNFVRTEANFTWYLGAPWWLLDRSTFVVGTRIGYTLPLNDISDFQFPTGPDGLYPDPNSFDGNILPLQDIDDNLTLPLSERYFLGGLGEFQLRGFEARSVGPRRALLREQQLPGQYIPLGRAVILVDEDGAPADPGDQDAILSTVCNDGDGSGGNGNGRCNDIDDRDIDDFEDLDETDIIGGNKFMTASFEYRFPISETLGLEGVLFFDTGNSFYEGQNLFDVSEWRYGTGAGVQWFSPFGPLAVIIGFPLDPLEDEDSPVFEFSVGGQGF